MSAADLPESLRQNPELDRWIRFVDGGRIEIGTGKVEIGQGILTALQLIAAEELDVEPHRIEVPGAVADVSPDEGLTAGSRSIEQSGQAVAQACAQARVILLERASRALGVYPQFLRVDDGTITASGLDDVTNYWTLARDQPFETIVQTPVATKPASQHSRVGRGHQVRLDIAAKLRGEPVFIQDMRLPNMLHARLVRPPAINWQLDRIDRTTLDLPADALLVDGSFVAVFAPTEREAVALSQRLARRTHWRPGPPQPTGTAQDLLSRNPQTAHPLRDGVPQRSIPAAGWSECPTYQHSACYTRPFLLHGSIGPSAALALYDGRTLSVWCASQGVHALRHALADALGLSDARVTVSHVQGPGCYGHNGADDAAYDAALCALARPGRPVLLQWTREQEHALAPCGSAMSVRISADISEHGNIEKWRHDARSFTHHGRPGRDGSRTTRFLSARMRTRALPPTRSEPVLRAEAGIHRNAAPLYDFEAVDVIKHHVRDAPLRTSALRSLGAHANVFAIECFMEELAAAAEQDPVTFRARHLSDHRAREVLNTLVDLCGGIQERMGVGIARYKNAAAYAAVAALVNVDETRSLVTVEHLWIVADAGRIIDRDGTINQLEGGAIQATSWTLMEAVGFDAGGVNTIDWAGYPILRFDAVPEVTTRLIDRPNEASSGVGEATMGPTSAAIANAVYRATGVRCRDLPLTPPQLRRAAAQN